MRHEASVAEVQPYVFEAAPADASVTNSSALSFHIVRLLQRSSTFPASGSRAEEPTQAD